MPAPNKLTDQQWSEILDRLRAGSSTQVELAAQYGVSKSLISARARKAGIHKHAGKTEQADLREALRLLAEQHRPLSVRQLYYRAVAAGLIKKTQQAYDKKVVPMVKDLREDGDLDWDAIVDSTRIRYGNARFRSAHDAIKHFAQSYRQDLMANQNVVIQVWAESDSVGSLIAPYAEYYGIPTYVGRGYSSRAFFWGAAKDMRRAFSMSKQFVLLHVGDYDPAGEDILRDVKQTLSAYALAGWYTESVNDIRKNEGEYDVDWNFTDYGIRHEPEFIRVAVLPEHITKYNLLTAPPKPKDTRTAGWAGAGTGTVEVEAMDTNVLGGLLQDRIEAFIDQRQLDIAKQAEKSEQAIMANIDITKMGGAA